MRGHGRSGAEAALFWYAENFAEAAPPHGWRFGNDLIILVMTSCLWRWLKPQPEVTNSWSKYVTHDRISAGTVPPRMQRYLMHKAMKYPNSDV